MQSVVTDDLPGRLVGPGRKAADQLSLQPRRLKCGNFTSPCHPLDPNGQTSGRQRGPSVMNTYGCHFECREKSCHRQEIFLVPQSDVVAMSVSLFIRQDPFQGPFQKMLQVAVFVVQQRRDMQLQRSQDVRVIVQVPQISVAGKFLDLI